MEEDCGTAGCAAQQAVINSTLYHLLEEFPYEIPVTVIVILMALFILFGNGLVIAAYISDRKLRTVTNFFLVNLVIADFIVGITIPISSSIYFIPNSIRTRWLCILQFTIIAVPLGCSTLCLLLITVERYLSVVYPFHHQQIFTRNRRYALVGMSWVLAFLIMGIIPFTLPATPHPIVYKMDCDMMRVIPSQYWSYVVLPFAYFTCGSVIIVYMKILKVARRQIKSIELLVVQVSVSDKKNIQNVRLARTGFILLGLFIIFWLPVIIVLTVTSILGEEYIDNHTLAIARISASMLAPASSAINPAIYAARIRRFKIKMKKLLHMTISHADKYVTYEIKQSFRVKRPPIAIINSPTKKRVEPVVSFDSGVEASTNEEDCEETEEESAESYEHFRQRALSRISESSEHSNHMGSPAKLSIYNPDVVVKPGESNIVSDTRLYRTAQPPQFLDIPSMTNNGSTYNITTTSTYMEELNSCTTTHDNVPSPFMRPKNPSKIQQRAMTPGQRNSSASMICAEPLVVECDNKSEYFRLVVRRTVRDCSDSDDSEQEPALSPSNANTLTKKLKAHKHQSKMKSTPIDTPSPLFVNVLEHEKNGRKTPDMAPAFLLTPSFTPSGSRNGTLERPSRIQHITRRPSLGQSLGSVGLLLDNDDIQFEITNANRGSKRMNKFKQINQSSLQRRVKKTDDSVQPVIEQDTPGVKTPSTNFVKDIWDGTIRRLRRSGRSKALLRHQKSQSVFTTSTPSRKLSRQFSHSLSDVSQPEAASALPIVHQRSRSALATSEMYVKLHEEETTERTSAETDIVCTNQKSSTIDLHIDTAQGGSTSTSYMNQNTENKNNAAFIQHQFKSTRHKRTRLSSWSHSDPDRLEESKLEHFNSSSRPTNHNYPTQVSDIQSHDTSMEYQQYRNTETPSHSNNIHTPSIHTTEQLGFYRESFTQCKQRTSSTTSSHYQRNERRMPADHPPHNEVMLPVRLRLPGGREEDIILTKQDIYSGQQNNKPTRRRHKSNDFVLNKVKRKRSMSQPNLNVKHFANKQ